MHLLIISHTPHYYSEKQLVGLSATVREIDQLSGLFTTVTHLAPLHTGSPPPNMSPYASSRIIYRAVAPVGGHRALDKLEILFRYPVYFKAIVQELFRADVVHVRCPANISLLAIILLAFVCHPRRRWVKYAGNWKPIGPEAKSYTFQRWWLTRNFSRSLVTVNGEWPDMPPHVRTFFNPCLTSEELAAGQAAAAGKTLEEPIRLLFVGRLDSAKGADRVLSIAAELRKANIHFVLEMIGDGPEKANLIQLTRQLGIDDSVHFYGWLPRQALNEYYCRSHFLLLPSGSEGWAKVISEAMAYGVVPIASRVGSIPQYLTKFKTGRACDPEDVEGFATAVREYVGNPETWKTESENSVRAAKFFGYSNYLQAVCDLLGLSQ